MAEVKLHGAWPSPYSYRVIWGLKVKGISYEYIEEDLSSKSTLLVQHNPVYKKIPVLVHGRKAICESMIILQYIDEVWPHCPLLPSDPYQRAAARFWIKFADEKSPVIWIVYRTRGHEQEKAVKDTLEMLEIMESHALGEKKFFGGDSISMVDLAFGQLGYWLGVIQDVLGLQILEADKFPRVVQWAKSLIEVPVIKENLPDRQDMFAYLKQLREMRQASGKELTKSIK